MPTVVGNVTNNDTLNSNPVTTFNTNVTPITTGPLSIDLNGVITLAANTPLGTYTITYTICEADPTTGLNVVTTNCQTAIAIVKVSDVPIIANDDSVTIPTGQDGVIGVLNALNNDTFVGTPANVAIMNIFVITPASPISGTIVPVLDTITGLVNVPVGTPAGTYTIEYQICVKTNSTNCDSAIITIIIAPVDDIAIYNHITPNGDGDNEFFFIDGIQIGRAHV